MSVQQRWTLVVVLFGGLYLSAYVELSVLMIQLHGQHVVSTDSIVWTGSPYTDVIAMVDVTSISAFGVETLCGFYLLMSMTLGAAAILLCLATHHAKAVHWGNVLGYASVALVGLFGTQVPGSPPRRTKNPFFLWSIDDSITSPIHLTTAALFLYVPLLCTLWVLGKEKKWWWVALYVVALILSAGYGIANLSVDSDDTLSPGVWLLLELVAFGGDFVVYAAYEIYTLPAPHKEQYIPLHPLHHHHHHIHRQAMMTR